MIRIHNSLTGERQELKPITPGEVRMYVCGMTVYDNLHIGHARMMTVFDMVSRYLRHRGYKVTYVRNITDIDDKIIRRAAENREPINALTERVIAAIDADCARLGILRPDFEPRATQYVPNIIRMVSELIERGYAYVAPNRDVMYSVSHFEGYGKLSGKRLADLRAGARIEIDEAKRDPLDFVLWKHSKPGEPSWESPWGPGRPGWHIECSAMSTALLGTHFDIHGGGMDLKFPHHENEIAQSCAATGDTFVNIWMHNGFVNVDNEKMSKSLGNFFTVRDVLLALRHPEVLRFFFLSSHYRGPINYSLEQLEQADAALGRMYTSLRDLPETAQVGAEDAAQVGAALRSEGAADAGGGGKASAQAGYAQRFREVMDDDFNTPEAIAVLQTLTREINSAKAAGQGQRAAELGAELRALGDVLGILQVPAEQWFRLAKPALGAVGGRSGATAAGGAAAAAGNSPLAGSAASGASAAGPESGAGAAGASGGGGWISDAEVERLIEARAAARKAKNWAESDRIRDELARAGVVLEDKPGGKTAWRRA